MPSSLDGGDKAGVRATIGSSCSSGFISIGNNSMPVSEEFVTGRRGETLPSFCQSLCHLKNNIIIYAIFSSNLGFTSSGLCSQLHHTKFEFIQIRLTRFFSPVLRCPSISDGRVSYQFSTDGYILLSIYAYSKPDNEKYYYG